MMLHSYRAIAAADNYRAAAAIAAADDCYRACGHGMPLPYPHDCAATIAAADDAAGGAQW